MLQGVQRADSHRREIRIRGQTYQMDRDYFFFALFFAAFFVAFLAVFFAAFFFAAILNHLLPCWI